MIGRSELTDAVLVKIREAVKKGNAAELIVRNSEGRKIFSFTLNAAAVGSLLLIRSPFIALLTALAAGGSGARLEMIRSDGTVIDLSGMGEEALREAKDSASAVVKKARGIIQK